MATLTFTVKNIYGDPIQGVSVEITPHMLQSGLGGAKTTNAEGKATFEYNSPPTSRYTITFSKDGYNTKVLEQPSGLPLDREFKLYEDIIKFKLYKYNENAHTEELYTGNISVEQYTYDSGRVTAPSTINPISISNDGYYHIAYEDVYPIVQTNTYLFKLTANDLTNYGSIFLLPNGFIKKEITNWGSQPYAISITENTLPEQKMVFYPNTKRLTKAELRMCVVSNPHLMEDGESDSYCPTNITYSTIYNMIKDSNNRDNNYISGVEDINFYQNKTLTIVNSASNTCDIKCYVDMPGHYSRSFTLTPGANKIHEIYYSADARIHAVAQYGFSQIPNEPYKVNMNENKTITIEADSQSYDYIIDELRLEIDYCENTGEAYEDADSIGTLVMKGHWGTSIAPNGNVTASFVFFDGVGYATAVFEQLPDNSDVNGIGSSYIKNAIIYANADGSESSTSHYGLNVTRKDNIKLINRYFDNNINLKYSSGGNYYEQANYPITILFNSGNCSSGDPGTTNPDEWVGGDYNITFYINNDIMDSTYINFYDRDGNNVAVNGIPTASKNCQTCDWSGNNEYDIQDSNGNSIDGGPGSGSFDPNDYSATDDSYNIYLT